MKKVLHMTYASSLTDLCEVNSSFDTGVLRVCYSGLNRNGSFISKDAIERSIKTIYNVPVVCNYNRDADELGGHDIEVVKDDDGYRIVNLTTPVGVVPESAKYWFDTVTEDDGTEHEYLYVEVLIWKRQEAYKKIKEDGVVAHSMEISVKDGAVSDGVYYINDFEFTAFALIGVEPCFESSALEMFAQTTFKEQLSEMMQDLKESYNLVITHNDDSNKDNVAFVVSGNNNTHPHQISKEGGDTVLEYNNIEITEEIVNETETEEVFNEQQNDASDEGQCDDELHEDDENFELESNVREEIYRELSKETKYTEWGEEYTRYYFVDYDAELGMVYCWDTNDWLLYGFAYSKDGDSITIDYDTRRRMKYVIAEFDEGEQASPFAGFYSIVNEKLHEYAEYKNKYNELNENVEALNSELNDLREFKASAISAENEAKRREVLEQFSDLAGIEAYDELCENAAQYELDVIEEKCFAIRGRIGSQANFSLEQKTPKIKISVEHDDERLPYGGIVEYYTNPKN